MTVNDLFSRCLDYVENARQIAHDSFTLSLLQRESNEPDELREQQPSCALLRGRRRFSEELSCRVIYHWSIVQWKAQLSYLKEHHGHGSHGSSWLALDRGKLSSGEDDILR